MRVPVLAWSLVVPIAQQPPPSTVQLPTADTVRLQVAVTARALQPGEVVRFDLASARVVTALSVRAFDKAIAAAPLGDGRWLALVGIDLDTPAGDHAVTFDATLDDGRQASHVETLRVMPVTFPTRQLRVAPRFVNPPPSQQRRIDRERRLLADLFRTKAPAPRWGRAFIQPIEVSVVSGFGVRSIYNGEPRAPHSGADFASPAGTPVLSPGGGRIVLAEALYFTGRTVVIDHGLGLVSLLAHLSRIDVRVGEDVVAGTRVGLVGATGRATGPHLHWTVRLQGARVDPLSVVAVLQDAGPH